MADVDVETFFTLTSSEM